MIRSIAFVGYANSGKTTLIKKLLSIFRNRGIKAAAVKHDPHGHAVARSSKTDTGKFLSAGAVASLVVSPGQAQLYIPEDLSPENLADYLPPVDIILVEGYKNSPLPKLVVLRDEEDSGLLEELQAVVAVVSPFLPARAVKHFYPGDIAGIADFIMEYNKYK